MLERPGLLLQPWAVRSTLTGEQQAQLGDDFAPKGEIRGGRPVPAPAAPPPGRPLSEFSDSTVMGAADAGSFADLDFLFDPAAVLLNLVPDAEGVIRIPRAAVGPHALVHVVAADPLGVTERTVALPEVPARFADLRLLAGLDPAKPFAQQRDVTVLSPGQAFTLPDIGNSRFEAYDSLGRVYGLYATLLNDLKLAEFAFVTNWPHLPPEEKRAKYSQFACHELNIFLLKKDPEFFAAVVKPYLANKKDKTFADRFLIGADLSGDLRPWEYGRLNTAERVFLSQRLPGEPAKTTRLLDDLLRLSPASPDVLRRLFDTAVGGGDLSATGRLQDEKESLRERGTNLAQPLNAAAEAPPEAAMGRTPSGGKRMDEAAKARSRDGRSAGLAADRKKDAAEKLEEADGDAQKRPPDSLDFFGVDKAKRADVRQLFRQVAPTMEWAENNYYHLPIQQQVAALVPPSRFWLDLSKHTGPGPFLSPHFAEAGRSFTEAMLALAVLDLPFDAPKHDMTFADGAMRFTPAGPAVAFHEEVRPAAPPVGPSPVLLSQNFYQNGDRYRDDNGDRTDKFVAGEFVTQAVYGCQVVVTNPTSARQKLSLLIQVPVGAVRVGGGRPTQAVPLDLEPYRTQAVDYLFYFPRVGRFAHFPATVSKDGRVVAAAPATAFEVVGKLTKPDTTSWGVVSQTGTPAEVLAFLARENVAGLDLDKIAFRMKDRGFAETVLNLLTDRHVYSPTLWSYSLFHADPAAARQYLQHMDQFVAEVGGPIDSPLLVVDPVARHDFEHLEYKPLVNARAHALGHRRQIVNDRLAVQYHHLLTQLAYRRGLADADLLAVTYYLLVQDRVDEARGLFERVNPAGVPTRVQYDYCRAYLAVSAGDTATARGIASRYAGYAVDRWRELFAEVGRQLDEADGKGPGPVPADDPVRRQNQLAATEPGFALAAVPNGVELSWQNLSTVRVNYYLMDVELLFSRNPFVGQSGGQFAAVRPNSTREYKLPTGSGKQQVPLPDEFARRNVLVEVVAAGQTRAVPVYASAMDVRLIESYGQVRVADAGDKPLPRVYVKVYARTADGRVKFYKDGYTDLRGRFDYATVSTPEPSPVGRFAVLVLSDDRGALIREAEPPQR